MKGLLRADAGIVLSVAELVDICDRPHKEVKGEHDV